MYYYSTFFLEDQQIFANHYKQSMNEFKQRIQWFDQLLYLVSRMEKRDSRNKKIIIANCVITYTPDSEQYNIAGFLRLKIYFTLKKIYVFMIQLFDLIMLKYLYMIIFFYQSVRRRIFVKLRKINFIFI